MNEAGRSSLSSTTTSLLHDMRGRAKKGKAFKKTLLQSSNLDEQHYKLHLHLKIVVSQVDYYYVAVTPKEIGRWR